MIIDIQCYPFDSCICRGQTADTAPFLAQILFLGIRQSFCGLLEPHIDVLFINLLIHKSAFIDQRHNSSVFDTIPDRIFVDQLTKPGHSILFPLHQRRSGKTDIAGVGEHSTHLGCHGAVVGTMALINQNKHILRVVLGVQTFSGIKLIDNGRNDICFTALNQVYQMPSACGSGRIQPGMGKGGGNLSVQFLTIRNDNHARVAGCQFHQDVLCQHNHSQALTATLGVPHHTTLAVTLAVLLLNSLDNLFDCKILLITADLLHIGIKQHEVANQFHDPLRAEQGDNIPVLFGRNSVCHQLCQSGIQEGVIFFFPHIPELLGSSCRGILHRILVGCQNDLGILEQLGNIVCLLIADILLHCLIHGNMGCLTLDYRKGNTVDKQHNIRTGIMELVLAFHSEFFCHMEQVVFPVIPVDVFEIEAERLTSTHGFGIAFSQQKSIVNFLTGAHQTIDQWFVQFIHSTLNVGSGEFIFRTGIGVAVQFAQLSPEDIFQQNMVFAAPLFLAVFR